MYQLQVIQEWYRQVLDFVRDRQGLHRTYIHNPTFFDFSMMAKQGTLAKVFNISDYEPLSLARTFAFLRQLDGRDPSRFERHPFYGSFSADPSRPEFERIDLFSVRFLVVKRKDTPFWKALPAEAWRNLGGAPRGRFVVYERRDALPRAYVAHHRIAIDDPEEALAAVMNPGFDPRRSVVIEGRSGFGGGDELSITHRPCPSGVRKHRP